ncbi:4504_t:CDS:1 [Cetraspora pellucida]|uniref:4504_t:CDS:1 n=1 Tax=Cetraspora pellucida TaxID=1433469 RepID=A0A9N9EJM2_9GLOM|nr:4504_t:CDS:1 [Cetraspora pellucida]
MEKLSILIFILVVITYVHAVAVDVNKLHIRAPGDPIVVTVESPNVFCSFLPRAPNTGIGASEGDAIAFCSVATVDAPNAGLFPSGLIRTMNFLKTDNYVQITGTINSNVYVVPTDGGGQYDINAPPGASCHGYERFVNLVEPNVQGQTEPGVGRFCIRCCNGPTAKDDCPTGRSTVGCENIIPGIY